MRKCTRTNCVCLTCGTPFYARPYDIATKGAGKHCSRQCRWPHHHSPWEPLFWAQVEKTETCWLWKGPIGSHGYGVFSIAKGVPDTTHRISYKLHFGAIPDGLYVLHTCPGKDERRCVNPAHLRVGTPKDNCDDATKKGHIWFPDPKTGERHAMAKLTEAQVIEIRSLYKKREVTLKQLGDRYGVSLSTIHLIVAGKHWKHLLPPALPQPEPSGQYRLLDL